MEKVSNVMTELIKCGVTAFHVTSYVKEQLMKSGFEELKYGETWKVEQGKSYVITPYPSMLVAFHIGTWCDTSSVRIATAHTDSPCLKLKSHPELKGRHYAQVNVEPYGGLIKTSWFDRPLGIAGKVVLRGKDVFHPDTKLIKSEQPVCIIPSLAPHLCKNSDKKEMDVQKELIPVMGFAPMLKEYGEDYMLQYICDSCKVTASEVLDYDLYLYNPEEPETIGIAEDMVCAPRIDNLASVAALLEGITCLNREELKKDSNIMVAAMFDNEEIGSRSKQGADSVMLPMLLDKLGRSLGIQEEEWRNRIAKGFLLSLDGAQGYHPNYTETNDPTNQVYLGEGIVIKTSATQRYLTDSEASAIIKTLCDSRKIKWQQQVNRSGMPGGQTLGPILAATLPLLGADVGIPMLAMHSARELAACDDYRALVELINIYYSFI